MARQRSFTNTPSQAHRTFGPHIRSAASHILASAFAEQHGLIFAGAKAKAHQASLGQFFTPKVVADFMANTFSGKPRGPKLRILDPGAGTGILSCALIERVAQWANKPQSIELVPMK